MSYYYKTKPVLYTPILTHQNYHRSFPLQTSKQIETAFKSINNINSFYYNLNTIIALRFSYLSQRSLVRRDFLLLRNAQMMYNLYISHNREYV